MLAAFDIGTNTVRCLAGRVEQGQVLPECYLRRITRLGGGYSPAGGLTAEAIDRTVGALVQMHRQLACCRPRRLRAVGTQALRQAHNSGVLIERVRQETGIEVEVISGDEEAHLSAAGILSALSPTPACCLFFDIGGGSTEFGLVEAGQLRYFRSFPVGVVRLAEDYDDSTRSAAVDAALTALAADLADRGLLQRACDPETQLVGTAGTVTTLAALHLRMTEYDWRRINNTCLPLRVLTEQYDRLQPLSPAERESLPGMEPGRGDLILPGLQLVLGILDRFHQARLTVSDFGLLEGTLLGLTDAHD